MLPKLDILPTQSFLLLDLVDVGMLVIEDERIIFANQTFTRTVGVDLTTLQSASLRELAGDAWVDFSLGQSWADALPWPLAEGGERWFEVTQHPVQIEAHPVLVVTCIDVTSRMRAEGAEANMLQMLTEIIEGYPVGTFVIDEEHHVSHWNRACEQLSGMSAADIVGTGSAWQAFYSSERNLLADWVMGEINEETLLTHYQGRFWKSPIGEGTYEAEVYLPMMRGKDCWLHIAATPLRNANGDIVGAIETLIDISERMRMEQMLAETIGGAPVGMFVIDEHKRVTHWNRVCESITGIAAPRIIGTEDAWKAFHHEPHPVLANLIIDGADEATISRYFPAGTCRRSPFVDGAIQTEEYLPQIGAAGAWLHQTAAPLRNAAGHVVGAIQTLIDISARKFAEEELRSAHLAAERLVAERTRELVDAKAALEEDIAHRQLIEQEMQRRLLEVTQLNVQLHDAQSKLMQSQQQLVQSEKLASIGQLAAGVAHEINNPIGYVFSNFGTLQNYLSDLLRLIDANTAAEAAVADEALRQSLAKLRKDIDLDYLKEDIQALMRESREGIERVRKIVQDLKDFSHVDASADWQWADLHRGLDSTLNIVHNEIKYKADVVREFGDLPRIQCLPSQLNQVFMNLLINAAHAMEQRARGTITVRTGVADSTVWVEVSDNGCGISEEVMGRIFDPFFTTKPVGKGTGLGLSLTYGIVQKHNGRITVCSKEGEGTTFRVTLPVSQPNMEEGSPT